MNERKRKKKDKNMKMIKKKEKMINKLKERKRSVISALSVCGIVTGSVCLWWDWRAVITSAALGSLIETSGWGCTAFSSSALSASSSLFKGLLCFWILNRQIYRFTPWNYNLSLIYTEVYQHWNLWNKARVLRYRTGNKPKVNKSKVHLNRLHNII